MARRITRRELLQTGAMAGASLAMPFFHCRSADAAGVVDAADAAGVVDAAGARKLRLKGRLILPGDAGYDIARRTWNRRFDQHPAIIAQCVNTDDVRRSVEFARKHNLETAVRSGAHSFAGYSSCNGGLVIDLSQMTGVRVDTPNRVARAEPGISIAAFDIAVAPSGLSASLGACPDVAVSGLTLGGGNGFLETVYGTASDNLVSAEVVTADAESRQVNANSYPDLYWAMRGAGANFGIATTLELRLHPVNTIMFGSLEFKPSQVRDVLRFIRDYAPHAPDELGMFVDVPGGYGDSGLELTLAYVGDEKRGGPVIRHLEEKTRPQSGAIRPTPYKDMVGTEAPPGGPFASHRKAGFFSSINDPVIDAVVESIDKRPSKWSKISFYLAHGARCHIPATATAYSLRQPGFECWIQTYWTGPAAPEKSIEWVDGFWTRTGSFATGRVYVNYLENEGNQRVRAAYGPNYDRLTKLKKKYDPANFFRLNQNIPPAV